MDKKRIIIIVLVVLVVVLSCVLMYLTKFNSNQAEPANEHKNEITDKKTEESADDKTINSTKEDSSTDNEKTEGLKCDEYERISMESEVGQKAIAELNRYYKKQNKDNQNIEIKKIEKCVINITGDGYAMGTDEKPIAIATFVSYYITTKEDQKRYIYVYHPDADEDSLISDYTYRFN